MTIPEYTNLRLNVEDAVAIITLDRPKVNGMDIDMIMDLEKVSHYCRLEESIRVVILTGSGAFFSAGGDLKAMANGADDASRMIKDMADHLHNAIAHFSRMSKPLIVAVNGMAAGGGLSLAMIGDLVIAAKSASFVMAYTAAGLTPDGSSTYFLPRIIGIRKTMELILTNRKITADQAQEWDMVNQVVEDDELMITAMGLAQKLSKGPTDAYGAIKKLLHMTFDNSLEGQMDLEAQGISERLNTINGKEGVRAFVEKRRPDFI